MTAAYTFDAAALSEAETVATFVVAAAGEAVVEDKMLATDWRLPLVTVEDHAAG